jgi:hypothetical protein
MVRSLERPLFAFCVAPPVLVASSFATGDMFGSFARLGEEQIRPVIAIKVQCGHSAAVALKELHPEYLVLLLPAYDIQDVCSDY